MFNVIRLAFTRTFVHPLSVNHLLFEAISPISNLFIEATGGQDVLSSISYPQFPQPSH